MERTIASKDIRKINTIAFSIRLSTILKNRQSNKLDK